MGGVGIWCMHFIGNNSLTITLDNNHHYQLNYTAGFTFASLVVAIITMFLAFIFVGITEEAKIKRIIFSGFVAGVCNVYIFKAYANFSLSSSCIARYCFNALFRLAFNFDFTLCNMFI